MEHPAPKRGYDRKTKRSRRRPCLVLDISNGLRSVALHDLGTETSDHGRQLFECVARLWRVFSTVLPNSPLSYQAANA